MWSLRKKQIFREMHKRRLNQIKNSIREIRSTKSENEFDSTAEDPPGRESCRQQGTQL